MDGLSCVWSQAGDLLLRGGRRRGGICATAADGSSGAAGRLADGSGVAPAYLLLVHQRAVEELPLVVVVFLFVDQDGLLRTGRGKADDAAAPEGLTTASGVVGGTAARAAGC